MFSSRSCIVSGLTFTKDFVTGVMGELRSPMRDGETVLKLTTSGSRYLPKAGEAERGDGRTRAEAGGP